MFTVQRGAKKTASSTLPYRSGAVGAASFISWFTAPLLAGTSVVATAAGAPRPLPAKGKETSPQAALVSFRINM